MMRKLERGRAAMGCEGGYEALQSMLKGEYTEESTGARTIRQTGGKDRHSKVFTARGPRDRRVRLSVATAIRFYDLQDRLGFEQPSKAVEWLLLHCQPSIQALPQLASLHPVRAATIPQPAYCDHHSHDHHEEKAPYKDEHSMHHQKDQKSHIDVVMHQDYRKQDFHHYAYTTQHHHSSLQNGSFPSLCTDNHLQDSIEEDPPQYSNPSSSGASSDHPISLTEVARPQCKATLAEAIPMTANHATPSTGMRQCSTSFTAPATIHMNKRHRMQHHLHDQGGHAMFASTNGTNVATNIRLSVGKPLGVNNGLSSAMNGSSLCNTANFGNLMIGDEDALLINNSLQGQVNDDMQPMMRLSSSLAYKPNQYVDITQLLFAAQANQLANVLQGAAICNQSNREEAEINGQACTTSTMNDTGCQLYNKIALQQVDELVCSNVYASPSPSESTSINTLAAAYSKAGGSNNMVDDQAAKILYRPRWNPSTGLQ